MSCIEAIHHNKTSGAAFMLEAVKGELSCNRSGMCCLLTKSVMIHSAQTRLWHGSSTGLCRIQRQSGHFR